MIFLAVLRRPRISDDATQPVQAQPVKPVLGPTAGSDQDADRAIYGFDPGIVGRDHHDTAIRLSNN